MPALAQQKAESKAAVVTAKEPGKVEVATMSSISATVEAIDQTTRQVTLKGPRGNLKTLTVGPEVRRFNEIKVGDLVVVRYAEALSLTLKKDGKDVRTRKETDVPARAVQGGAPAGVAGRQVEVTANVIAVDAKTRMVTLRGPKQTVDLKVADPEQFKLIKVGDQIQAVYTEAMAVSIEAAAPAKK